MRIFVFSLTICICCNLVCMAQQIDKDDYEVFPTLKFDYKEVAKNNFQLVSVWFDENKKSETDESGIPWSEQLISYQRERHILPAGQLDRSAYYNDKNEKLSAHQYYYIGDKISAIDEIGFDTLQNEIISYSFNFAYKDSFPYQKVKLFKNDKGFRLLYDYLYDKDGKMVRLNVTAHGEPKKEESLKMAEDKLMLLLVAHSKDSKTARFYKNMHDLQLSERIQYNEKGLPINMKLRDGENALLLDRTYVYEDEKLVKEIHTKYKEKSPVAEKLVYYTYHANGLIDRIIEEEGSVQYVWSFQYFEEY